MVSEGFERRKKVKYDKSGYPRPQFRRDEWISLDGIWTCHIERKCPCFRAANVNDPLVKAGYEDEILVPFAPETKASGLHANELIDTIYYHRKISVPSAWKGKRILLHFGAVFYHAEVFIDGALAGFHDGGSTSFTIDITEYVCADKEYDLVVKATADLQDGSIPSGKQSSYISSYQCFYQRTTGIWQSVWMEGVARTSVMSVKTVWSPDDSALIFTPRFRGVLSDHELTVKVDGTERTVPARDGISFSVKIRKPKLWWPGKPYLYDITYTLKENGNISDTVHSYAGLRSVEIKDGVTLINGKKLYQRLVLDQGFYPESNWTSPSDKALERDIKLSMAAGFNGARLHQKVFEEKFFHYADKLGYLVWGESPSWGLDYNDEGLPARNFLCEWREIIERDVNHPSIICWTPLNETWNVRDVMSHRRLHRDAYMVAKSIDPTRPVNDASGYIHFITDLWTVHHYEQDSEKLRKILVPEGGGVYVRHPAYEKPGEGQPYLIDEYGGVKWDPETQRIDSLSFSQNLQSWGYGNAPRSEEEYISRVRDLTEMILSIPSISGYCYTQLTDVEQEKNGIYFYNRKKKFDMKLINEIFSRKPDGFI